MSSTPITSIDKLNVRVNIYRISSASSNNGVGDEIPFALLERLVGCHECEPNFRLTQARVIS